MYVYALAVLFIGKYRYNQWKVKVYIISLSKINYYKTSIAIYPVLIKRGVTEVGLDYYRFGIIGIC